MSQRTGAPSKSSPVPMSKAEIARKASRDARRDRTIKALTTGSIRDMTAGRDLDRMILECVWGFEVVDDSRVYGGLVYVPSGMPIRTHLIESRPVPDFSTDMTAAWHLITHHLSLRGYDVHLWQENSVTGPSSLCSIGLTPPVGVTAWLAESGEQDSMPLAICKAVLILKCAGKSETAFRDSGSLPHEEVGA